MAHMKILGKSGDFAVAKHSMQGQRNPVGAGAAGIRVATATLRESNCYAGRGHDAGGVRAMKGAYGIANMTRSK